MLAMALIVLACVIVLGGLLLLVSYPGKPTPIVDRNRKALPNSISEKIFVNINGLDQGMMVKSQDKSLPVLLYLHGGMPDYFLTHRYPTGLESIFTVVWWEQRGAGISYDPHISRDTLTVEQLICDTLEVTHYLRRRFDKAKVYLMGHSGGTFIGIQAAARVPSLYEAYIGIAQMSYQLKSEKLAYDYMLSQFKAKGDANMVRKLETAPVTMTNGTPNAYCALRDSAMHRLGVGTTHDMKSVISGLVLPSFMNREYTFREKINTWRAKANSGVSALWAEMLTTDLSQKIVELAIPTYFMHGVFDYTCSYTLAKSYFEKLSAPVKGFYQFEHSAHSPLFEEPEKMQAILREDVLSDHAVP